MAISTSVKILIDQRGNSNKIWAQVLGIANSEGKVPVIHGPIRKNGAGLVEKFSSANWQDKERNGYQMLVWFDGVPHGLERTCVAAIAHVKAGETHHLFNAGSPKEIAFAKRCAEAFLKNGNWGGRGFKVDLSKEPVEPDVVSQHGHGKTSDSTRECETCQGTGTIDERQGGEHFSNPMARCPDCDGKGYFFAPKPSLSSLIKTTRRSSFF
jgi:hypothetical protein